MASRQEHRDNRKKLDQRVLTSTVTCNASSSWTTKFGIGIDTKRSGNNQIQIGAKPATPIGRVPRISRLLALAHHGCRLIQSGAIINQSELAHFGQISTTRMTQIKWLDNIAPDIQEEILFLPRTTKGRDAIKEADLRPIAKTLDWSKKRQMWKLLVANLPTHSIV
jgi:hypothetical protein